MPTWLNEGLAEYFGEGIFTGDGFVTGVISPERLAIGSIEEKKLPRAKPKPRVRLMEPVGQTMGR